MLNQLWVVWAPLQDPNLGSRGERARKVIYVLKKYILCPTTTTTGTITWPDEYRRRQNVFSSSGPADM